MTSPSWSLPRREGEATEGTEATGGTEGTGGMLVVTDPGAGEIRTRNLTILI